MTRQQGVLSGRCGKQEYTIETDQNNFITKDRRAGVPMKDGESERNSKRSTEIPVHTELLFAS